MRIRYLSLLLLHAALLMMVPSYASAAPIQLRATNVTASSTYPGSSPSWATDGNPGTAWNAWGTPTQWIQLDLGRNYAIRQVRMQIEQVPNGFTSHRIFMGQTSSSLREIKTISGHTQDGQWLEFNGTGRSTGTVRFIRIQTDQSPSWVAWKEIQVFQGVEYVSFFRDSIPKHGTGNYIDETTAAGANLVWVGNTPEEMRPRLQQARARNAKGMLDLEEFLFWQGPPTELSQRWSQVATLVRENRDAVGAFYLQDEPYLGCQSNNEYCLSGCGTNVQCTLTCTAQLWTCVESQRSTLSSAAATIRNEFPDIPIAVIISEPEVHLLSNQHLAMFDWVGFDYYQEWSKVNMPALNNKLEAKLSPHQRMVAVPWAYIAPDANGNHDTSASAQNKRVVNMSDWYAEVTSHPRYVAVVPFLWQTAYDMMGARDLPLVKDRAKRLALSLTRVGPEVIMADVRADAGYMYGVEGATGASIFTTMGGWLECPTGYTSIGYWFDSNGFWLCARNDLTNRTFYVGDVEANTGHYFRVSTWQGAVRLANQSWDTCLSGSSRLGTHFTSSGFWVCMN